MATIRIDQIKCERKQDVTGSDEPILYLGGIQVWEGKMNKDESLYPKVTRGFSDNILVELREANGNKQKSLGKWTVSDTPTANGNAPLTATSSGYHYELYFDVY